MDFNLAKKYAPRLYLDRNEPFFPVRAGVSVLRKGEASPSFRRSFDWDDDRQAFILEYAIYWDYDIGHLYELEHVWIYVGTDGIVLRAEASFHGKYLIGLLSDRSNLEDETHVRLYSQPGKHAFMPRPELFELVPNLHQATTKMAGNDGLLITGPFQELLHKEEDTDDLVRRYLQSKAFLPAMEFAPFVLTDDMFVSWAELLEEVPQRIQACVEELKRET